MRRLGLLIAFVFGACNGPENTSQSEQLVVNTPAGYNFGNLMVNGTSPARTTTFSFTGFGADVITQIDYSCPDFDVQLDPLPAEVSRTCEYCDPCPTCATIQCCPLDVVSYSFVTYFTPHVGGQLSCVVTAYLQSGTYRQVTFTGTGDLPPVDIDIQPPSVGFGDVRRNTASSDVDVSVRNAGGGTMNVSSVSISAGFLITSGPMGGYQVGGGASMPYTLACNPTATGPLNGYFTVNSDDPNNPSMAIALSCNGIDSALDILPSPATLATTRVGEPVSTNISLKNTGAASMQLEGVTVAGTDIAMTGTVPSGTIGANGSKPLTVRFGAAAAGNASATLTVTYDGGQQRTSQITARALATSISMSPDGNIDFGPICVGQNKSTPFTVLANAEGSFKVKTVATSAPFAATTPTLPFVVQGSGANKLMFDITATPTADGATTSNATISTDIPGGTDKVLTLSVTGIAAGITPNPGSLDFGQNEVNTTTIGQPVHLSNCSTSGITFTRPRIEGTDAADFAIVSQPDSATINPAASATWLIVFQGHTDGAKTAMFLVDYDGGVAMIPLTGESFKSGAPPDPNNPLDERSYYTCSSSGSSFAFVPFVVAFLVWRRRRRRV